MYPLPRLIATGAVLAGVVYGIVALLFLAPGRVGAAIALWGLGPLVLGLFVACIAHGEPSDQATVHSPHPEHLMSEAEFDALEDRVDRLGAQPASEPADGDDSFRTLVRAAIDDLPPEFRHALDHVAVVVSDQGALQRLHGRPRPLYGLYVGYGGRSSFVLGAPAGDPTPDRIVIFRDTLTHDFGDDPERLREQVTRTLRHELAHHLGWDEPGVRALGL